MKRRLRTESEGSESDQSENEYYRDENINPLSITNKIDFIDYFDPTTFLPDSKLLYSTLLFPNFPINIDDIHENIYLLSNEINQSIKKYFISLDVTVDFVKAANTLTYTFRSNHSDFTIFFQLTNSNLEVIIKQIYSEDLYLVYIPDIKRAIKQFLNKLIEDAKFRMSKLLRIKTKRYLLPAEDLIAKFLGNKHIKGGKKINSPQIKKSKSKKSPKKSSARKSLRRKSPVSNKKRLPRSNKVYKPSKYIKDTVWSDDLQKRVKNNSSEGKKVWSDFRKSEAADLAWLNSL